MGRPKVRKFDQTKGPAHLSGARRYVAGRHVIEELLSHALERLEKIFVVGSNPKRLDDLEPRKREIIRNAQAAHKPIQFLTHEELSALLGTPSHQGFGAIVKEINPIDLGEFLEKIADKESSLVLLLDGIEDPQNLGAILRASECFGVDAVIWSRNRGVDITPVVSKASVGASELVRCIKVGNLADAVRKLKDSNYWIAAAVLDEEAEPISDFDAPKRVALVVGAEGEGLSRLVTDKADYRLYIPQVGTIQSLNVSQAAAILLFELSRGINGESLSRGKKRK